LGRVLRPDHISQGKGGNLQLDIVAGWLRARADERIEAILCKRVTYWIEKDKDKEELDTAKSVYQLIVLV
jgi:hypothetical protein